MRTALRNHSEVCHVWASQAQESGRSGSMFFENGVIYSYGKHFPIARWYKGHVLFTTRTYSITTSRHTGDVRQAIPSGTPIIRCQNVTAEYLDDHVKNIIVMIDEINALVRRFKRARAHDYRHDINAVLKCFRDYCGLFRLRSKISKRYHKYLNMAVDDLLAPGEIEAFQRRHETYTNTDWQSVRNARWNKRMELLRMSAEEKLTKWRAGESVGTAGLQRLPVALRIKGTRIETSHGAQVLIESARPLWALVKRSRQTGETYTCDMNIDYYTAWEVSNGDVRIGCHSIKYTEMERIAGQLNW